MLWWAGPSHPPSGPHCYVQGLGPGGDTVSGSPGGAGACGLCIRHSVHALGHTLQLVPGASLPAGGRGSSLPGCSPLRAALQGVPGGPRCSLSRREMCSAQGAGSAAPSLPFRVVWPHLRTSQGLRTGPPVLRGGGLQCRPPEPPVGGVSGGARCGLIVEPALARCAAPPRAPPWCGPTHPWAS